MWTTFTYPNWNCSGTTTHYYNSTISGDTFVGGTLTTSRSSRKGSSSGAISPNSANISAESYCCDFAPSNPNKIETGRVAQGDKSNQEFVEVHQSFEYFANTTVKYRILPISQKPVEIDTVTTVRTQDVRNYCPSCGRRIKRGWVHCAGCGEKI